MDKETPETMKSKSSTVRFNVGGKIHEVSRSLLNQYPDSMLARMASNAWFPQKNAGDDKNALFIERDGERFRYCLDYMRDGGTVDLPPTVSKKALLRDLEYYGFHGVDASHITVTGTLPMYKSNLDCVNSMINNVQLEREMAGLAQHCLISFKKDGKLKIRLLPMQRSLYTTAEQVARFQHSKELFRSVLGRIGLNLVNCMILTSECWIFLEFL